MRRMLPAATACFAVLIGVLCWLVITSGEADWLNVKTPSCVYRNRTFDVEITLLNPESGSFLGIDLHGMNAGKVSQGYLAGIRPVKIVEGKCVYNLSIPVGPANNAAFAFGVVFLSLDGTWQTRVSAASLDPLPVLSGEDGKIISTLNKKAAYEIKENKNVLLTESLKLRICAAGIWFIVAVICAAQRRHIRNVWISAAALASAIWELLNGSMFLGNILRSTAWLAGAYNDRRGPQQVMTLVVIVTISIVLFRLIFSINKIWEISIRASLAAFWCISLLRLFSLHEIDEILSKTIIGIESGQLARLTVSAACLVIVIMRFCYVLYNKDKTSD